MNLDIIPFLPLFFLYKSNRRITKPPTPPPEEKTPPPEEKMPDDLLDRLNALESKIMTNEEIISNIKTINTIQTENIASLEQKDAELILKDTQLKSEIDVNIVDIDNAENDILEIKDLLGIDIGGGGGSDINWEKPANSVDVFGIIQLYETDNKMPEWTSEHWNNGINRDLKDTHEKDPYDPLMISQRRGSNINIWNIDGQGHLRMSGIYPRIYFNGYDVYPEDGKEPDITSARIHYINTEITMYYKRIGTAGQPPGGGIIGVRSSPIGHSVPKENYLYTDTYYGRVKHEGKVGFQKELTHTKYSAKNEYKYWDGDLPPDIWYGIKFVCYTKESGNVVFELYLDDVSGGNPENFKPENWKLINSYEDRGEWSVAIVDDYKDVKDSNKIIKVGYGVPFIRNSGGDAIYKYVTIREIKKSN